MSWGSRRVSLVSPDDRGPVGYAGSPLRQYDGTTCGSTSLMVARAMNDPLYALSLTTNDNGNTLSGQEFSARIKKERDDMRLTIDAAHIVIQ